MKLGNGCTNGRNEEAKDKEMKYAEAYKVMILKREEEEKGE